MMKTNNNFQKFADGVTVSGFIENLGDGVSGYTKCSIPIAPELYTHISVGKIYAVMTNGIQGFAMLKAILHEDKTDQSLCQFHLFHFAEDLGLQFEKDELVEYNEIVEIRCRDVMSWITPYQKDGRGERCFPSSILEEVIFSWTEGTYVKLSQPVLSYESSNSASTAQQRYSTFNKEPDLPIKILTDDSYWSFTKTKTMLECGLAISVEEGYENQVLYDSWDREQRVFLSRYQFEDQGIKDFYLFDRRQIVETKCAQYAVLAKNTPEILSRGVDQQGDPPNQERNKEIAAGRNIFGNNMKTDSLCPAIAYCTMDKDMATHDRHVTHVKGNASTSDEVELVQSTDQDCRDFSSCDNPLPNDETETKNVISNMEQTSASVNQDARLDNELLMCKDTASSLESNNIPECISIGAASSGLSAAIEPWSSDISEQVAISIKDTNDSIVSFVENNLEGCVCSDHFVAEQQRWLEFFQYQMDCQRAMDELVMENASLRPEIGEHKDIDHEDHDKEMRGISEERNANDIIESNSPCVNLDGIIRTSQTIEPSKKRKRKHRVSVPCSEANLQESSHKNKEKGQNAYNTTLDATQFTKTGQKLNVFKPFEKLPKQELASDFCKESSSLSCKDVQVLHRGSGGRTRAPKRTNTTESSYSIKTSSSYHKDSVGACRNLMLQNDVTRKKKPRFGVPYINTQGVFDSVAFVGTTKAVSGYNQVLITSPRKRRWKNCYKNQLVTVHSCLLLQAVLCAAFQK